MGGTFQLPRDARSTPGVHLAFNFGSIVGVGFRGHHEAVAVYPHITGMEGEMDLCWGHRQEQVGPCASRDGPTEDPLPRFGVPCLWITAVQGAQTHCHTQLLRSPRRRGRSTPPS